MANKQTLKNTANRRQEEIRQTVGGSNNLALNSNSRFDRKNGARPVKRAVQTYLEDPLTDILLRKPNQKKIIIKNIQPV